MGRKTQLTVESAQQVAVAGLNFLASDPEHLGGFLAVSGLGPENLRSAARDPGFLAAVMEYLMQDESLLLAFCAASSIAPEDASAAHYKLTPPDMDNG